MGSAKGESLPFQLISKTCDNSGSCSFWLEIHTLQHYFTPCLITFRQIILCSKCNKNILNILCMIFNFMKTKLLMNTCRLATVSRDCYSIWYNPVLYFVHVKTLTSQLVYFLCILILSNPFFIQQNFSLN